MWFVQYGKNILLVKVKEKKKSVREKYKKNCMVGITLVPINNLFR